LKINFFFNLFSKTLAQTKNFAYLCYRYKGSKIVNNFFTTNFFFIMKQFFAIIALSFSCALNAQMYTNISVEQPLLGYSDTTETVVSLELSDYYRRGFLIQPFEGRISQRGLANISVAKIGLGLGTLNDLENFRFGGTFYIEPIAFKNREIDGQKTWQYNATSVDAFLSYDFINDGTNRFGMKAGAEVRYETVNVNPGFQISLKAGFYYGLGHEAIMPAQMGCPTF